MNNKMRFEEALAKLSEITTILENNELDLDENLKHYEEGIKLYNYCRKKLNEYEAKVKLISNDNDGNIQEIDFMDGE